MRKQLVIKIPDKASSDEINAMVNMIIQSYIPGYPLFIFPDWEYEVVEVSEPMMILNSSNDDEKRLVEAMKKVKLAQVVE